MMGRVAWRWCEHNTDEVFESVGEPGIGEFVAGPAANRHHYHQSTIAQASQVVRHVLPGHPEGVGQVAGECRRTGQLHKYPGARRV
ncbi:MAG: hypothetical protein JWQ43_4217 [Glaciihabitans sp.]|nr:hypothetical protein [Glaciihabitans sp.]